MKNFTLAILVIACSFITISKTFSQNCIAYPPVKDWWWGAPGDQDYGFSDDSINVSDVDTAQIFQGEDTIVDFQYLMPKKYDATSISNGAIGVVDVVGITVTGVTGLPAGLMWDLDVSGATAGNSYNPQTYRFGAVRLCGTTFVAPGVYEVLVSVNATVSTPIGNQNGSLPIPLYIEVLSTGGNCCFTFSPSSGCDTANVDFEAIVPSPNPIINPISYEWDFTNDGSTDATGNMVSYSYTTPGDNIVSMDAIIEEFYISGASITATDNSCYCGDAGEIDWPIIGCTAAPDLYLIINAGGGEVTLSAGSDNTSNSWSGLDIPLSTTAISVQGWDEDTPWIGDPDDNLGSAIISFSSTPSAPTTLTWSTSCATGTIVLEKRILSSSTTIDTVTVYTASANPLITNVSGNDTICPGDSITLSSSMADSYEWTDTTGNVLSTNQTYVSYGNETVNLTVVESGTNLSIGCSKLYNSFIKHNNACYCFRGEWFNR